MKKERIFILSMFVFVVLFSLISMEVAYGNIESDFEIVEDKLNKEEIYKLIIDNEVDFRNENLVRVLGNWYDYFEVEDMFLTKDGEYVDYTTYQITRMHFKNLYRDNERKVAKKLLSYGNFPKEYMTEKYEEYIYEYIDTVGREI